MITVTDEMIQVVIERLIQALDPEKIYLFGSYATGRATPHSDLDILIVVPDDAGDEHELAGRGWIALRGIRIPVDIVVFHESDMAKWIPVRFSLPYTVSNTGKLLYAA